MVYTFLQLGKLHLWIRRFSSRACSSRSWLELRADLKATVAGAKEMSRGIILPPLVVTRMMAERVPLGPATRTRPAGRARRVVVAGGRDVVVAVEAVVCGGNGRVAACCGAVVGVVPMTAAVALLMLLLLLLPDSGEDGGVRVWMEKQEV